MLDVARLKQLILILSSSHDREVIGAVKAIGRMLANGGHDFHWLADRLDGQDSISMPKWRPRHSATGMSDADRARWCLDYGTGRLSREERGFLYSLSRLSGPPTTKQRRRLADLHERLSQRT